MDPSIDPMMRFRQDLWPPSDLPTRNITKSNHNFCPDALIFKILGLQKNPERATLLWVQSSFSYRRNISKTMCFLKVLRFQIDESLSIFFVHTLTFCSFAKLIWSESQEGKITKSNTQMFSKAFRIPDTLRLLVDQFI